MIIQPVALCLHPDTTFRRGAWTFGSCLDQPYRFLGDVFRYTIAPVVSCVILPIAFRKLFSPRSVPLKFKKDFPYSLTLRPKGGLHWKRTSSTRSISPTAFRR
jgi:hypothetical protein